MIIPAGAAVFDGTCDQCGAYRPDLAWVPGFDNERYGEAGGYFCPCCYDAAVAAVEAAKQEEAESWDTDFSPAICNCGQGTAAEAEEDHNFADGGCCRHCGDVIYF